METEHPVGYYNQLRRDYYDILAAESDPAAIAEYATTVGRDPEMLVAEEIQQMGSSLVTGLANALKARQAQEAAALSPAADAESENTQITHDGEIIAPDEPEESRPLTPDEILKNRLDRKITSGLHKYNEQVGSVSHLNTTKRENRERSFGRAFIQSISDLSDLTGDEHIVLRPDLLSHTLQHPGISKGLITIFSDRNFEYAERNGPVIASDPKRFADIISKSVEGRPHSAMFNNILKGIYSTRHNRVNYTDIRPFLAETVFESLDDFEALKKITRIAFHRESFVSHMHMQQHGLRLALGFAGEDLGEIVSEQQVYAMFEMLKDDLTGYSELASEYALEAREVFANSLRRVAEEQGVDPDELLAKMHQGVVTPEHFSMARNYDPVEGVNLYNGDPCSLGQQKMPDEIKDAIYSSDIFIKRMRELAPYTYSAALARKLLGGSACHRSPAIVLSPTYTTELFVPNKTGKPNDLDINTKKNATAAAKELLPLIINMLIKGTTPTGPMTSTDGLRLGYMPFPEGMDGGVAILRPGVTLDREKSEPIQLLSVDFHSRKYVDEKVNLTAEQYQEESDIIRAALVEKQVRFLGRRPIKLARNFGGTLESIQLRVDEASGAVKALMELKDGTTELELSKDLRLIGDSHAVSDQMRNHYENLILQVAYAWCCYKEVHTSEGVVSEESGISANMGHFAYLRIQDGKKWKHSEKQAKIYLEEQGHRGTTLQQESERLLFKPEAADRNSTYVKEKYDPNKPPLEIYLPQAA